MVKQASFVVATLLVLTGHISCNTTSRKSASSSSIISTTTPISVLTTSKNSPYANQTSVSSPDATPSTSKTSVVSTVTSTRSSAAITDIQGVNSSTPKPTVKQTDQAPQEGTTASEKPVVSTNSSQNTTPKMLSTSSSVISQSTTAAKTSTGEKSEIPNTTPQPILTTTLKQTTVAQTNSTATSSIPKVTTNTSGIATNIPGSTTAVPVTSVTFKTSPSLTTNSTASPAQTAVSTNASQTSTVSSTSTTTKTTSSSKAPTTTKTSTSREVTTTAQNTDGPPSESEKVYINEIMMDKDGGFQKIELQMSTDLDVSHYMMVMVDGRNNKMMSTVYLKNVQQQMSNGLLIVTFNSTQDLPSLLDNGTGIAIYDTQMMTMTDDWTASETGLVDALVIGKTYADISSLLIDVLTPDTSPFVINPNKYGSDKTISRCSAEELRNTDMFALVDPSFGVNNDEQCQERLASGSEFSVKIKINCHMIVTDDSNVTKHSLTLKKVIQSVVKQVNKQCQCGVTSMHIQDPVIHCCDGTSIDMRFVASSMEQVLDLKHGYQQFLQGTNHILNVENQIYALDNTCSENCCNVDKHPLPQPKPQPQDDDKTKNVKVTVAVIVSCLIVFIIVVLVVVMYMKRKKSAVYQFRMSRLDEEDDFVVDGPDHEEFVGGQEATFDIKH